MCYICELKDVRSLGVRNKNGKPDIHMVYNTLVSYYSTKIIRIWIYITYTPTHSQIEQTHFYTLYVGRFELGYHVMYSVGMICSVLDVSEGPQSKK